MHGRSIRLFLVDGTASGLRTAELGLSTIKCLVVPRASLSTASQRPELQRTGLYVLVGPDPDNAGLNRIYIGEGDVILTRLTAHNKDPDKDFWDQAIVFTSKDQNLTKAHVRYLEARFIFLALQAKRTSVANGKSPGETGRLPEADEVEMEEFISQARLLLGTLGYDFFDPTTSSPAAAPPPESELSHPTFHYEGKGYSATCTLDASSGHFVVKQGSTARMEALVMKDSDKKRRQQLIDSGIMTKDGEHYVFSQDYPFTSLSAAAAVVSATAVNGPKAWKTEDGQTFAEWEAPQLPADEAS